MLKYNILDINNIYDMNNFFYFFPYSLSSYVKEGKYVLICCVASESFLVNYSSTLTLNCRYLLVL